jgi:predicted P-loop ATPase
VNHMPRDMGELAARLLRDKKGGALPSLANAMLILAYDPSLSGLLRYCEFSDDSLLLRSPPAANPYDDPAPGPYPRAWGLSDTLQVVAFLQRAYAPRFTRQVVEDAMEAEAHRSRSHPVREYLDAIRWDGVARIDTWLTKAFGAEPGAYSGAIGAKFLIAAVRRVRQPGCKFDQMPVLEGNQGIGKSRACRALFGSDWFTDQVPNDLSGKEASQSLLGVWGLEFSEIDQLIRTEVETIKAFLSRQSDRYRLPYARRFTNWPRQCVIIGTTNSSDYLRDVSGNRRIWPVRCTHADAEWVEENRDQLWAEAAMREASGEAIWLDGEEAAEQAKREQDARMEEDVWAEPIRHALADGTEVTARAILLALKLPTEKHDRRAEMRVGKVLRGFGYQRSVQWQDGKTVRLWIKEPPP